MVDKKTIHIIGDSHSRIFGYFKSCRIIWLGAITMHHFKANKEDLVYEKYKIPYEDIIISSCGEIDVRCHVGRQRDKYHRQLSEILDELVKYYIIAVAQNCNNYKFLGIKSISPPNKQPNTRREYKSFPFYGSLLDRIRITKMLNKRLKNACQNNNLLYLDTYTLLCDNRGVLKYKYSDGHVHLNPKNRRCMYILKKRINNLRNSVKITSI